MDISQSFLSLIRWLVLFRFANVSCLRSGIRSGPIQTDLVARVAIKSGGCRGALHALLTRSHAAERADAIRPYAALTHDAAPFSIAGGLR
jgi:hypothetical protein